MSVCVTAVASLQQAYVCDEQVCGVTRDKGRAGDVCGDEGGEGPGRGSGQVDVLRKIAQEGGAYMRSLVSVPLSVSDSTHLLT